MIYIKNTTETQTVFIPRNELQKEAYITSTKTYEDGYREGLEDGKEQQKDQLLNLYVTENGEYNREDGWGVVTVDMSIPDCSGAYDEGYNQGYEDGQNSVECPECDTCNLGEGSILLDTSMAGTYELYASDDGYDGWSKFIVTLEGDGAIRVHKASDLLDTFNNGGTIDYGTYYYVGGEITNIKEVNTQYGNATYTLDNGLLIYRGKWTNGEPFQSEDQIKVGAYIVVYGVIADYKGTLQFNAGSQVIAYQECEGGEVVSCNLEDKGVSPSMADRDGNGVIIIEESEGFDGLSRVVLDPTTIYNEGVSAGKAEGGDLTIGTGDIYLTANERGQKFEVLPSEFEYDAFDKFIVELENFDLGGDANIYDALSVNQLLKDGHISYGNVYLFKGQITEIQRIRPDIGDARYTLDKTLAIYNGQTMGYDIQVGDNVIVIGTLSEYNGAPQLSGGSMIKVWWRSNCEGGSANLITPIIFSESEGNTINAESVQIPTFVYEGNQHYNVWALNMAEYEEFKIQIRFQANNGGNEEPVNIFGCEDTDWDNTTFGARIYQGQIYFRMSGEDVSYPYNESAWYDVEMGYNSSKRWIIVNGETLFENDHASFNKPSQTLMIGAINSGGNAFRPFYGKIAAAFIEANGNQVWLLPKEEGHMDVYWNDRTSPWIAISGENNARFEREYISGDGMKTITWLGKRVSCPSVQEQMNEYYYNPITVADSGFGERAKEFSVLDETMISNDEGILYGDKYIYVPSSTNRNEIRTKVNVDRMTFPFKESDSMYMGKIWIENGVGVINFNGLYFNNLYYFETPLGCGEIKLTNCTLNNLNTLVIRASGAITYDFRGTIFKDGGVLKVSANLTNAEEIRAALGSGWTITIE